MPLQWAGRQLSNSRRNADSARRSKPSPTAPAPRRGLRREAHERYATASLPRTRPTAPAGTVTMLSAWPTESCSSRARRLRCARCTAWRSRAARRSDCEAPSRRGASLASSPPALVARKTSATGASNASGTIHALCGPPGNIGQAVRAERVRRQTAHSRPPAPRATWRASERRSRSRSRGNRRTTQPSASASTTTAGRGASRPRRAPHRESCRASRTAPSRPHR